MARGVNVAISMYFLRSLPLLSFSLFFFFFFPLSPTKPPSVGQINEEPKLTFDNSADPKNCIKTICMCEDGKIYSLNKDNLNKDLHGCDPPGEIYPMTMCELKMACCKVPTKWGNDDDNPVLT